MDDRNLFFTINIEDSESDWSSADSDPEYFNMSELERKKLSAARGQCKASFTRLEKYLSSGCEFTVEELQVRKQSLLENYSKFKDISLNLQVLGETAEEEDETEDRFFRLMAIIERHLKFENPQGDISSASSNVAKLPSLDIPVFDGKDISAYKPFIEMFLAVVHNDARISNIQKLCFLKKYLKGEPLQIIDSLPIIGKSYDSALELLQKRYDNPALLINNHVTGLLDLQIIQRGTAPQLRDFVAKVRQHVRSLQNLKQAVTEWNALLSCILLRKLDPLNVRLFHSERDTTTSVTVDELLRYLDKRAASLEASPMGEKSPLKMKSSVNLNTSNNLKKNIQCKMCSKSHKLYKCPLFNAQSPQARIEFVNKNQLCNICLTIHTQECRYKFKCSVCNSSQHNTLLHVDVKPELKAIRDVKEPQVNLHVSQPIAVGVLLPTAKVIVSGADNKKFIVRALLDSGSQTSFCTADLAKRLGSPLFDLQRNIDTLGGSCNTTTNKGINFSITSLIHDYKFNVTCPVIKKITSKLPQRQIDLSSFIIPKNVPLADDEFHIPGHISLLLGSDIFFSIMLDGKIEGGPADPILLNTKLGYIVSSTGIPNSNTCLAMHTVIDPDLDHCVRQFWEAEKVPDVYHESLPENEYSEKIFQDSVSLQNNTFEVKYPLKIELQEVDPSNSFAIALQRLYNLEKRFTKDPVYHDLYKAFIHEYIELGHAKIIDTKNCDLKNEPLFFLPHHGVFRNDKTTNKLRVVFDGSARTKNGLCLNDIMCNGPVVQPLLFDILMLFRTYKYTIQCDIRHMYRCIKVHPDHRCLQNILWRENGVMSILQLQTVTYGLTSSAFLATRCLNELAKRYKKDFPLASAAVLNNSYIDDVQAGGNTVHETLQLKHELVSLLQKANLNLHKWVSNCPELLEDISQDKLGFHCKDLDQDKFVVKILGISYDARDDVFRLSGKAVTAMTTPTKRNVLSSISKLFDPMGFAGPITMKAKLFMQELWQRNFEWDTPLPIDLETIWNNFYTSLVTMPDMVIPRYVQNAGADEVELVGYCDASASGYGCCIYIRTKNVGKFNVHLLCSRSRLNSANSKLTIPKLELNGALLLAKLVSHVSSVLNIPKVHLFCDSKIVLGWLDISPVKVPAYIGNRVREINKLQQNACWHFTPGMFNPADILSRGADPKDIVENSLWKHGPDHLHNCTVYNLFDIQKPIQPNSKVGNSTCLTVLDKEPILPVFEKYSSLLKTIRVIAYVLRFVQGCKKCVIKSGEISVGEFREALTTIIRGVQHYFLAEELKQILQKKDIKTSLKSLHPFIDAKGVCRVGGRLINADVNFSKKFPVILPKKCHITKLIIRQEHLFLMHGGIKLVLSSLAQRYYIINSVREVKSVIHKCVICCRHKAETSQQLMGSLPKDRVIPTARIFERVGLDYCGPFEIKQSSKRNSIISKGYVALFVCFISKAIHIEVVSDMSTDTFLAAFKRFISRRGVPSDVHCDNATTFKGANNKLHELYNLHCSKDFQEIVHNYALQREIKFHFIPAYSPNHGGLWEAAVKSAKYHLKRISTNKIYTYEQFSTIMTEIEGILNSRPLMYITSQDSSDFSCLTPGHFIIGCPLTAIPHPDLTEIPTNRLRFWRCCERVRQHFWQVWSKDYLCMLNERTKWRKEFPNLKEGAVVLLLNPNTPPLHWPLGRVTKTFCGSDNKIRVVEIITSNGKLHTRAVSKIVVLPIE